MKHAPASCLRLAAEFMRTRATGLRHAATWLWRRRQWAVDYLLGGLAILFWAVLLVWRRRRLVVGSAAVGVGILTAVNLWVIGSTHRYRYQRVGDVPRRQTAIVLGALVYRSGRPSDILRDRLDTAADLYLSGRVEKVLVSGDHGRNEYDEVNNMRRYLQDRGLAAEDIFMDHAGFDTCDTMQRAGRVFGVRSAVVVTQAFHLPRAVYLARASGLDAVGLEADRRRYRKAVQNQVRESLARVKSFGEIHLGLGPRFVGPQIPIGGDGHATWDRAAWIDR